MPAKVFISYRRDDSAGHAGRVHDRLEREFGRDLLFMDVDAIPLGMNFIKVLSEEVSKCDVLLAIIGPGWLEAHDEDGQRRLDNPNDFVRIEIATALKRDIPVIPILLEGTRVPKAHQLPDDLKELAVRNGLDVRHASFHADMDKLIRGLKPPSEPRSPTEKEPSKEDRYRAEGRIKVDAKIVHGSPDGWFKPGMGKAEWFKDHEHGPEMVVVPAGRFLMGSPLSEARPYKLDGREEPLHNVTIAKAFSVGRYAVTFDEWDACVAAGGCKGYKPDDQRWGRGRCPVINVSWNDAQAYVMWLSKETGTSYRLLSEAEREYVTRAGTATPFWWGSSISATQANYVVDEVYGSGEIGEDRDGTVPVDSFEPNPFGLYQVHGNVCEWCEDCWHDSYRGAPIDGSPWNAGCTNVGQRVVRGGSWFHGPQDLRSTHREGFVASGRIHYVGFRVGRTLTP